MLERIWLCNTLAAALSYAVGARLSGLPGPGRRPLWLAALTAGLLATVAAAGTDGPMAALTACAALLALPGGAALCFARHGWQAVVRATVTSLLASLLLGGLGELLARLRAPGAVWLALTLLAPLPALLRLTPTAAQRVTQAEVRVGAARALLPAMLDTGNLLTDALSGLPVIVIGPRAAAAFFPTEALQRMTLLHELPPGVRLLRARTAAGPALLPVFRPDALTLYLNGRPTPARALIAIAPRGYGGEQALVPLAALSACEAAPRAEGRAPSPRKEVRPC